MGNADLGGRVKTTPELSRIARSRSNSPQPPESGRGISPPRRPKTPQRPQLQGPDSPSPISRKDDSQVLGNLNSKGHLPDIKVSSPTGTATDPSTAHGRPTTPIGRPRSNDIVRQNVPQLHLLPKLATPSPAKSYPDAMELDSPLGIFGLPTSSEDSHPQLTVRTDVATPSSLLSPYSSRSRGSPMEIDTVPSTPGSPGSPMNIDEN